MTKRIKPVFIPGDSGASQKSAPLNMFVTVQIKGQFKKWQRMLTIQCYLRYWEGAEREKY